jgi:hypothetical protein
VFAGGGFLSCWNHQLIKFEEEKGSDFKKQFFNYEKRELNTPENYLFYTPRAPISDLGEFLISIDFTINYPRTK